MIHVLTSRKKKAKILVVVFVLLLGIFFIYFGSTIWTKKINDSQINATNMQESITNEEKEEESKEETIEKAEEETIKNNRDTWKIKIPTLNLVAPIAEGTSQEVLAETVGHFEESNVWEGNVALAAHNRGYECNFFQEIKNLKKGDIIIYQTQKGERKYKVVLNQVIKETNWSYIENTKDNRITLITCEANRRQYRRCVQGVEIKE